MLFQVNIRPGTENDLEVLVRFNTALARETEGRCLDEDRVRLGTISLLRNRSQGFYLVAEVQNESGYQIIGQLMVTYEWSDWRNGVFWWIQSVYVDANWRGKGVFRRLYEQICDQARMQADVVGIRLYVEEENARALNTYKRLGLHPTSYRVFEQDFVLSHKGQKSS